MRIVVDTNVIVSALVFGGLPRKVLDLAAEGVCAIYFSAPIQAEVERILEEKFGWSRKEIGARCRLASVAPTCRLGPRFFVVNWGRTADLQNRSALLNACAGVDAAEQQSRCGLTIDRLRWPADEKARI